MDGLRGVNRRRCMWLINQRATYVVNKTDVVPLSWPKLQQAEQVSCTDLASRERRRDAQRVARPRGCLFVHAIASRRPKW